MYEFGQTEQPADFDLNKRPRMYGTKSSVKEIGP